MKIKNITFFFLLILGGVIASCQKEEEIGGTATQKASGDWFVRYSDDGGKTFHADYLHFATYNSAANKSDELWLDDLKTFWEMKGLVTLDLNSLTFKGTKVKEVYNNITFDVDGKILEGAAKGPGSKTPTDSIYMKIEFSDDPGTEYILSGYKRTGFLEDEH
ncbi:hypothetical protein OHD16_05120 [Sphingobacterium sp. ML3W]|uniref:lipid-binding protein n=1 Tax=Sphingobacterium sp. ML3W TaxID=1538644 RepID=UPI00249BC68D|nr:lipid-binding protein [Sphingobacterium sp. ML3W]WFA79346.1 hypothetical protein OGI71_25360 [Sphingobacterium sp. ML3W]